MKLRFKVDQAAALMAGINATTSITEIDVDPAQLSEIERRLIADRLDDGINVNRLNERGNLSGLIVATTPDLAGLLRAVQVNQKMMDDFRAEEAKMQEAKKRKEDAEREEQAKLVMELSRSIVDGKLDYEFHIQNGDYVYSSGIYNSSVYGSEAGIIDMLTPEAQAVVASEKAKYYAKHQEEARVRREKEEADKAAAAAAAERRKKAAVEIIEKHGTDAQRERFKRGLMGKPEAEALNILRGVIFAGVNIPPARKPSEGEIDLDGFYEEKGEDADLPDLMRDSEAARELSDDQIAKYLPVEAQIKSTIPEASVVPWFHEITRDDSSIPWVIVLCARATVHRDGFEVSKDFAVE